MNKNILRKLKQARGIVHPLLTDLKSCSVRKDLLWGKRIHAAAVQSANDSHLHIKTALIKMYAKCSSMSEARRVFHKIQKPDVVAWNALILGYVENGEAQVALELFSKMKSAPNSVTYLAVLKACAFLALKGNANEKARSLKRGRSIHSEIGCHFNLHLQSTLIDMYAKCGSMNEAAQVFDTIRNPDVISWNALLLGYAENGIGQVSLDLFSKMKAHGCVPDFVTYLALVKACTSLKGYGLEVGRSIHSKIGVHMNLQVQNALIDMYAKSQSMGEARRVFDSIHKPDVVSWNSLLMGYVENGEGHPALALFSKMKAHGCAPDSLTYVAVLMACTSLKDTRGLATGRDIHSEVGHLMNPRVQSTLIDMYAKCGSMLEARKVFDSIQQPDVVSWNALLHGYVDKGEGRVALELSSRMKTHGCAPNSGTCIAVLKACTSIGALAIGRKVHLEVTEFDTNVVTCLVDLYAKCGSMPEARAVFERHPEARGVSTWNALLAGYSTSRDTVSVFNLFQEMQDEGFKPDAFTFLSILLCCSHGGLVGKARKYLNLMPVYGVTLSVVHYNCIVDALGRANQLNEAIAILQKMPCSPDAVIWMTLLGICRRWKNVGVGRMAFQALVEMDNTNASVYVLMGHIYGSRGMWDEQQWVLRSAQEPPHSRG